MTGRKRTPLGMWIVSIVGGSIIAWLQKHHVSGKLKCLCLNKDENETKDE